MAITFEGGADQEPMTTGNTGFTTLGLTGASGKLSAAAAHSGSLGGEFLGTSTAGAFGRRRNTTPTAARGTNSWFEVPAISGSPAFSFHNLRALNSSAVESSPARIYWYWDSTASAVKMYLNDSTGGTARPWGFVKAAGSTTTDLTFTPGDWIQVKFRGDVSLNAMQLEVRNAAGVVINNTTDVTSNPTASSTPAVVMGTALVSMNGDDVGVTSVKAITQRVDDIADATSTYAFPADYAPAYLDLVPADATVTGAGWTKVGAVSAAATLSDTDDGTYWESPANPVGSILSSNKLPPFQQPTGDFVVHARSQAFAATSSSVVGKLYSTGGTLLATSQTATPGASMGDTVIRFLAASIDTEVTAAQWNSGALRFDVVVSAS